MAENYRKHAKNGRKSIKKTGKNGENVQIDIEKNNFFVSEIYIKKEQTTIFLKRVQKTFLKYYFAMKIKRNKHPKASKITVLSPKKQKNTIFSSK
jgi:hypothetical protein